MKKGTKIKIGIGAAVALSGRFFYANQRSSTSLRYRALR